MDRRTGSRSRSIKSKMTQIFNVVVRTAGYGYDCGWRGSMRDDDVHNGELFDYHADDAEDVQRFAAIQWK